jgi:WD40 repeat protein
VVGTTGVRLREQVYAVDLGGDETSALLLEPFQPNLVAADGEGIIRVSDYAQGRIINEFSLASVHPYTLAPPDIHSLHRLNDLHNEVLLVCAGDGVVSVWRDYATKGQHKLATSWRTVLNPLPGTQCAKTTYCYSPELMSGVLFAAGGRDSQKGTTVNVWDLQHETCASQLVTSATDSEKRIFQHIASAKRSPVVFAVDTAGLVRIFDVRAGQQVGDIQGSNSRVIGVVSEPGRVENQLVMGHRNGTINFYDWRKTASNSLSASLWRTVEGHSKGNVTVLCGHSFAPLLATATASQVVKVWSTRAEQVGVVRAHQSVLGQPGGPYTCLGFAPFSLSLASGGKESVCAVYSLELAQQLG